MNAIDYLANDQFMCSKNNVVYQNGNLIFTPIAHNNGTTLFTRWIRAPSGQYEITLDVDVNGYSVFSFICENSTKVVLHEGLNKITVTVPEGSDAFRIVIFIHYVSKSKTFVCRSSSMIDHKNENNCTNVLLVADCRYWCFDHIARAIARTFSHKYKIYIDYCNDCTHYRQKYGEITMNVVIKFWYGFDHFDPFLVYPNALKVVAVYDYIHWNPDFCDGTSGIYQNFIKNMKACDVLLYSCSKILDLLRQINHSKVADWVMPPQFIEANDGVDTDLFRDNGMVESKQLIVGWAGDTTNVHKNYSLLSAHLTKHKWIKFITQPKSVLVKHEHMPQFYQSVNVVVCFSAAEGTPNIILEASASGKPWVSSDVGIVQKLMDCATTDCKPGFIVQTIEQMIEKLAYLHENRQTMNQMGKVGRECVQEHFNIKNKLGVFDTVMQMSNAKQLASGVSLPLVIIPSYKQTTNAPKIIIASTQYPRYGGAATCAYEMHKYLLSQSITSMCIFFDNRVKKAIHLLNPDHLPHVYLAPLSETMMDRKYVALRKAASNIHYCEPYLIYAFNCLAPAIARKIFPHSKIYYMITGCSYINNNRLMDSTQMLNCTDRFISDNAEKNAICSSDAIVPNSSLTKNIFEHYYQTMIEEVVDLHEVFKMDRMASEHRKYDIAFVCSNYDRKVKNATFLKKVFTDCRLTEYTKICVGTNSKNVMGEGSNLVCIELLSQKEIMDILSSSKIVIICSYIETFSIVAVEAAQCGAMVLVTKNAACAATINKYFVLDTYEVNDWAAKIDTILQQPNYYQKIFYNYFTNTRSCDTLWTPMISPPLTIVCISSDAPYIGGCATNMYRLIKTLKDDARFNIFGVFIGNIEKGIDPDKLGCIYGLPLNTATMDRLSVIKSQIITTNKRIDLIFLKNYKLFPFVKRVFPQSKIIFSPSGLRAVSGANNYALDVHYVQSGNNLDYSHSSDIYQFVKENDVHLDFLALSQADIIVPNSLLSYRLIDKLYYNPINLKYPIYLTNIVYDNLPSKPFSEREIDVVFCAYNWKRKCKNSVLMAKILGDENCKHWRVTVVGKHAPKNETTTVQSITYSEYLTNENILHLFSRCKVLVIPSTYDSSPNVLIEAIASGCNVVTSANVGNSENLNSNCIVLNYDNSASWVQTINRCLTSRFDYTGPTSSKITSALKNLFLNSSNYKKSVGIRKIPPDAQCAFDCYLPLKYVKSTDYELIEDIVQYDIYFNLLVELSKKQSISDINYIIYDDTLSQNIYFRVAEIYPTYTKDTLIWKLKDMAAFNAFTNADLYFIRGTYYHFFQQLIPPTAQIYYYPATAPKQNRTNTPQIRLTNQKMDVVLHHETNVQPLYDAHRYVYFSKFCTDKWVCTGLPRIYDLCFVATADQSTKNHHLFIHLLHYLHETGKKCSVMYVGDLTKVIKDTGLQMPVSDEVHYTNVVQCNPTQLSVIYNQSKINILFSGRDFYPRVICESAACGCYNVALDTLSDGKSFYTPPLGTLIGNNQCIKKIKSVGSLSYENNRLLWEPLVALLDTHYNHNHISETFKNKYNLNSTIQHIYDP